MASPLASPPDRRLRGPMQGPQLRQQLGLRAQALKKALQLFAHDLVSSWDDAPSTMREVGGQINPPTGWVCKIRPEDGFGSGALVLPRRRRVHHGEVEGGADAGLAL